MRRPGPGPPVPAIARHDGQERPVSPRGLTERKAPMALPTLTPEQRQVALAKAREARRPVGAAGRPESGTLTLADVLGREDDTARRTKVAQVVRALPGVGQARTAAVMERAGIPPERRGGGLGPRPREQPPAEFAG